MILTVRLVAQIRIVNFYKLYLSKHNNTGLDQLRKNHLAFVFADKVVLNFEHFMPGIQKRPFVDCRSVTKKQSLYKIVRKLENSFSSSENIAISDVVRREKNQDGLDVTFRSSRALRRAFTTLVCTSSVR